MTCETRAKSPKKPYSAPMVGEDQFRAPSIVPRVHETGCGVGYSRPSVIWMRPLRSSRTLSAWSFVSTTCQGSFLLTMHMRWWSSQVRLLFISGLNGYESDGRRGEPTSTSVPRTLSGGRSIGRRVSRTGGTHDEKSRLDDVDVS